MIAIGRRNYQNPERNKPVSPLGRYLLYLIRRAAQEQTTAGYEREHSKRIMRQEAFFFILGGTAMIIVMLGTLILIWVLKGL